MKTSESRYSQCLYFTTAALARKVEKMAMDSWAPVGLSPSHGYLLLAVVEEPGIQPSTLGSHLQLKPSTITRLMEKLEAQKLLVRIAEGKQTCVYPSQKAKEMLPRLKACVAHFSAASTKLLGREEGTRLVKDLASVSDRLDH
ncbi:MAG: winged helix-turn-helix transcriptional regulator [Flaviaesturariibacter sp.]|nr:winged helix-turn-helix transcriptional regulator [Flaviaesturariibacter sp.]